MSFGRPETFVTAVLGKRSDPTSSKNEGNKSGVGPNVPWSQLGGNALASFPKGRGSGKGRGSCGSEGKSRSRTGPIYLEKTLREVGDGSGQAGGFFFLHATLVCGLTATTGSGSSSRELVSSTHPSTSNTRTHLLLLPFLGCLCPAAISSASLFATDPVRADTPRTSGETNGWLSACVPLSLRSRGGSNLSLVECQGNGKCQWQDAVLLLLIKYRQPN